MHRSIQKTQSPSIRLTFGCFALALLLGASSLASAQTAHPGATISIGSGFSNPEGVAVDGNGNVFVADTYNNSVKEIVAVNGAVSSSSQVITIGSGFSGPYGVAVDSSGDVFVADTQNSAVKEIVAVNGVVSSTSVVKEIGSGFNYPTDLAFDRSGNLFVSDGENYAVKEIVAVNGVVSSTSAVKTIASGFYAPGGVAVDAAGNVFVADSFNGAVKEIVAVNGVVSSTSAVITVGSGFSRPWHLAVDGTGNVFVTDIGDSGLKEIVAVNGTVSSSSQVITIGIGSSDPWGVAVDRSGNIFLAGSSLAGSANNPVQEIVSGGAQKFPTTPVGRSAPMTIYFTFDGSGSLASTPYVVLTQGVQNLDFRASATQNADACIAGHTYDVGDVCTVNVTFAPLAPGPRMGAVELSGSSGNVLATTPVYGQGQGSAVAFDPGIQTTLISGLSSPEGVAVDAAGNLFIADSENFRVLRLSPGGAQTALGSGLSNPTGVAVDGAGNVFIADASVDHLVEVSPNGAQTTVGSGLAEPQGVAVDGAGNVFIADMNNNRVVKVSLNGSQTTVVSGLNAPAGVAVDGMGNLFIADEFSNSVLKVSPDGTQTTVASGLNQPTAVAVDAAGNVFIADTLNNRAVKVSPNGIQTTLISGLVSPGGVAVDASGNVFVSDQGNGRVLELQRSQPPTLSFATTQVGSTSSDSPQSVIIENIGNQPLNAVAPGLTIGANFTQAQGSGTPADCTAGFALAPGESCNLSINFIPQTSGNIQSTAVLTDNALNATAATQTINLSGTGILATATIPSAATGQYSDPVTLAAVVDPSGAAFSGLLQFQVNGANACSVAVTGGGRYTCSYTVTEAAGSYAIGATLISATSSVQGSTGNNTLTVTKEDASIIPSGTNPAIVQVTAPGGTAGPITLKGTVQQAADGSTGDLAKAVVTVTLVPALSGAAGISCPATNTNGALTATCSNVPVDAYTVQWSIGGDYYTGPAANSVLAVYDPSLGFVTGSGSVLDNGIPADFAISVKYLKDGTLRGGITYIEHRATGDVTVSSAMLSSMSLVRTTAIVNAQTTVNGTPGYTLQLTATDNGSPGINRDTFGLQVSGGTLNPPISFAPAKITAGQIQTH